jgi:two-component system, NtrC family, sensor kinase
MIPGEAATHLSWLIPRAASLVALARPDVASWMRLRSDVGCVLLVARFAPIPSPPTAFSLSLLRSPDILQGAIRLFDQGSSPNRQHVAVQSIDRLAHRSAELAWQLAKCTGKADPELAWMGGLLAPLGWLALAAADPDAVGRCLADPGYSADPAATQRSHWGLDAAAVARRLARRWNLPSWLGAIVGHLALPAETAVSLGADATLFRLVQLAVVLAQQEHAALGIEVGTRPNDLAAAFGLSSTDLGTIVAESVSDEPGANDSPASLAPLSSMPLLRDLLVVAEENLRLCEMPTLGQLESDMDELHRAYAEQRVREDDRLRRLKLGTMAEFAAGAGHEINNPLAVISGQAQYLLGHEVDPGRQTSLQKIIGQAQRINELLNQLMQFARPSRPHRQLIDLTALVRNTVSGLADLAQDRRVRLSCAEPMEPLNVFLDPKQMHMALAGLLRNGIEAAPPEGWVTARIMVNPHTLDICVEDSGPGPTAAQRPHIFDPFYSGRQAGRGRGLGLPTAWRLAREHGGDVFLDEQANGPTRFVLRLPRDIAWNEALASGCSAPASLGRADPPRDRQPGENGIVPH